MTHISAFSAEEIELLMSLPYKVGMWLSYADDEDGESDDEQEQKALHHCLKAIADLYEEGSLVKDVLKQTLSMKSEWPRWATQAFHVPSEAEKAVSLLQSKVTEDEMKAYAAALIEIATTVAAAYGEFSSFDEEEPEKTGFGALVGKIVSGFSDLSKDDENHPMNISAAEDSAIAELTSILKAA